MMHLVMVAVMVVVVLWTMVKGENMNHIHQLQVLDLKHGMVVMHLGQKEEVAVVVPVVAVSQVHLLKVVMVVMDILIVMKQVILNFMLEEVAEQDSTLVLELLVLVAAVLAKLLELVMDNLVLMVLVAVVVPVDNLLQIMVAMEDLVLL
jgi:hypothetical protein